MTILDRFRKLSVTLSEEEAQAFRNPGYQGYTVQALPPRNEDVPATLEPFVDAIKEPQTSLLKLKNKSPVAAYEIRRHQPDRLTFHYATPTKRLERKIRTQLPNSIDRIELPEGVTGLPVHDGASVGGGLITTGRTDRHPLRTGFDKPPINSVAAALHRHALPGTRFVIQVLFQPVAGQPIRSWYRSKRTGHQIRYLKKEKEQIWGRRSPSKREKNQADKIEEKAGSFQFKTSIRFIFTNAQEISRSRVKEIAGAFNQFDNTRETGQYLNAVTVDPFRRASFLDFLNSVATRRFNGWSRSFRTSTQELAGLVSLPNRQQKNIRYSQR